MKLRRRQVLLLAVATLVFLAVAAAMVHHHRAKRAVADYRKQLIAQGEILEVDGLIPRPAPVELNGTSLFFQAMARLNPPMGVLNSNAPYGMTMVAPGRARVGFSQPSIRSTDATNTWEEAELELASVADALASLEGLIERPKINFNLEYRRGFSLLLPHLSQTKQAAQYLNYAVLCDLHRVDTTSALTRLRALVALSQGNAEECLLISQLVRIAIAAIGATGTWELLQSPNITDEQLAQIQSDWSRLEFLQSAEQALAMERAMGQMTVEQMRSSSAEFRQVISGYSWPGAAGGAAGGDWHAQVGRFGEEAWGRTRLTAKEAAWRFSWAYTDQLRTLKGYQVLLECARDVRTNGNFSSALRTQEERLGELGFHSLGKDDYFGTLPADLDLRTLLSQGILSLNKFMSKVMTIEATRSLVIAAAALERYKLRHHEYPPDLAALVPDFLPAVPRDPVDGEPLRYRLDAAGAFLLYSVGEDGADDQGDATPANPQTKTFAWQRGRDWVWPQPATPEEIEAYFAKRRER